MEHIVGRGFEKVSRIEEDIQLPLASTANSAGYDFFAIEDTEIPPHNERYRYPIRVRLGVKAFMQPDEVLLLFNRSSNPSKFGLVQANSVGVIDSDYYNNPDNEGEIGIEFYNMGTQPVIIKKGQKVCQGIFMKYLKTNDDNRLKEMRNGGYGSTGK